MFAKSNAVNILELPSRTALYIPLFVKEFKFCQCQTHCQILPKRFDVVFDYRNPITVKPLDNGCHLFSNKVAAIERCPP